ncbi:MAG: DNA translocase FtsK, partial [Muribaculaceae bacterium]|nr:DNA translocase FtsK [Muribaculaceae bacterium]
MGLMGLYGMIAVNVVVALVWVLLCYKTLHSIYENVRNKLPAYRKTFAGDKIDDEDNLNNGQQTGFLGDEQELNQPNEVKENIEQAAPVKKPKRERIKPKPQGAPEEAASMKLIDTTKSVTNPKDPTGEYMHYRFPTLSLLNDMQMKKDSVDVEEQESNKQRITETLNNYGIQIKKIDVHVGPTVTLFEIVPADGVRISKIRGLEDDIALSLSAIGIRIIAPMPGRGTIGIEIPNRDPQVVPMRQVLASKAYQDFKGELPMVLGCTVSNEVFVADLAKVPHLLVAGATGKGKSVGLNTIITSLLYKKGPSELKFILIDPKRVEFSVFSDLEKYFFAKAPGEDRAIVTDTSRVVHTLNCLVQEMENRYKVFEHLKERKVTDYNKLWREKLRNELDEDGNKKYHFMPYIVCIIDEFSDMIMTAGKEVETPIVRLAQKGRAAGIHIIIATQRPSAQVITGLIKSNVPGR